MLIGTDGLALPWKEFRDKAMEIDDTYNKRWLQTEYNQAHTTALQARRWKDFEKTADLYPNLVYIAVNDERTRASHRALDGTTRPINDPFWDEYSPPLDWGCRCTLRPSDKEDTSTPADLPELAEGMDINPGKEAKIFSDNHPYIKGSADRANELKQFVASQMRSVPEIHESFQEFEGYGKKYDQMIFNGNNGGFAVKPKNRNFDKIYGHYEKGAVTGMANGGYKVEVLSEIGSGLHLDIVDVSTKIVYEIKTQVEGSSLAIKRALEKGFRKQGADNIILNWPGKLNYKEMKAGVDRYAGQAKKENLKIGAVYYINSDGKLMRLI